jgi:hypothetical protein
LRFCTPQDFAVREKLQNTLGARGLSRLDSYHVIA